MADEGTLLDGSSRRRAEVGGGDGRNEGEKTREGWEARRRGAVMIAAAASHPIITDHVDSYRPDAMSSPTFFPGSLDKPPACGNHRKGAGGVRLRPPPWHFAFACMCACPWWSGRSAV